MSARLNVNYWNSDCFHFVSVTFEQLYAHACSTYADRKALDLQLRVKGGVEHTESRFTSDEFRKWIKAPGDSVAHAWRVISLPRGERAQQIAINLVAISQGDSPLKLDTLRVLLRKTE